MPDITRLFKGPDNEFEVEVVFAQLGDKSPKESHAFREIILILEGSINLERSDEEQIGIFKPLDLIELPIWCRPYNCNTGNTNQVAGNPSGTLLG